MRYQEKTSRVNLKDQLGVDEVRGFVPGQGPVVNPTITVTSYQPNGATLTLRGEEGTLTATAEEVSKLVLQLDNDPGPQEQLRQISLRTQSANSLDKIPGVVIFLSDYEGLAGILKSDQHPVFALKALASIDQWWTSIYLMVAFKKPACKEEACQVFRQLPGAAEVSDLKAAEEWLLAHAVQVTEKVYLDKVCGFRAEAAPGTLSETAPKGTAGSSIVPKGLTLVDGFEKDVNSLGGKGHPFTQEPSKIDARRVDGAALGRNGNVLKREFDKRGEGGPYGNGGWCGYGIPLRQNGKPFDASKHSKLVFWVRGQSGGENFKVGLADLHWARMGDSIKSEDIVHYVPDKKITTKWQKVEVALGIFYLEPSELVSASIAFDTDCFPDGAARGVVYLDNLGFE